MDFNIKKHINVLKNNIYKNSDTEIIKKIIRNSLNISYNFEFSLNNGILNLKNNSSIVTTKIKLKKELIIKELKKHNIYIRDII